MPPRSPVPDALRAVAAQQESLVCTRQCLDAGVGPNVLTRLVRSGSWSRITAGVYDLDPTPLHARPPDRRRRRAAWAALLAFGPEAVAVGPCALALLGVAEDNVSAIGFYEHLGFTRLDVDEGLVLGLRL